MTEAQEELLRKASDSLNAAKTLMAAGYPGFAAARAYYTMFYIAEAFLLDLNLTFSKHQAVIAAFAKHFVKPGRISPDYHLYLRKAFEARMTGDYEAVRQLTANEARLHITRAGEFLKLAEEKLGGG